MHEEPEDIVPVLDFLTCIYFHPCEAATQIEASESRSPRSETSSQIKFHIRSTHSPNWRSSLISLEVPPLKKLQLILSPRVMRAVSARPRFLIGGLTRAYEARSHWPWLENRIVNQITSYVWKVCTNPLGVFWRRQSVRRTTKSTHPGSAGLGRCVRRGLTRRRVS